ncbi:hypothetical protein IAD21_02966 [Abditibacteriota bacterium]|nr:hypothetical protein IAD21_02966 [Abditibacteriota bacterium]
MNQITNRQALVLCVLSTGIGALFSPLSPSVAQPPQVSVGNESQLSETPQPLATPPASPTSFTSARGIAPRAVGTITGEGTTGHISKFTGTNAIGDSVLFENGGKIGLGTTAPPGLLSVQGTATNVYSIFALNTGSAIIGSSSSSVGVYGVHTDTTGDDSGVSGETSSTSANAAGVLGTSKASSAGTYSAGVRGVNLATNTVGFGVYGVHSGGGIGVYGLSPAGNGVWGESVNGIGIHGRHTATSGTTPGVVGETNSTTNGATAVQGIVNPTNPGTFSAGVSGINNGTGGAGVGVYGSQAGSGFGVYGSCANGKGIVGGSTGGTGVEGSSSTGSGVSGSSNTGGGITGATFSNAAFAGDFHNMDTSASQRGVAIRGLSAAGTESLIHPNGAFYAAAGEFSGPNGIIGAASYSSGYGVIGVAPSSGNGYGLYSSGNAYVTGKFTAANNSNIIGTLGVSSTLTTNKLTVSNGGTVVGNLSVTGKLTKGSGSFKIDHPLHPATEYLSHSFVESPDMMNIYNGNAITNSKGEAWVQMPGYFAALNREFRYQLTPMGQFAQAIIGQEIHNNRFLIKTDKPNVKVSWQVTGVRHDVYARQNRIKVEETKTGADRGKYLYPAGFGFGKDKQIGATTPRLAQR